MQTDDLDAAQAALDGEEAASRLDQIGELHRIISELKTEAVQLRARLRSVKSAIQQRTYDLTHRLDQAAKRRIAARDRRTAAALAGQGKEANGAKPKG